MGRNGCAFDETASDLEDVFEGLRDVDLSSEAARQRVPVLLNLLQAPRVGDLAKGLLLRLLEHYGLDTHDPSLIGAFVDLHGVLKGQGAPQAAK